MGETSVAPLSVGLYVEGFRPLNRLSSLWSSAAKIGCDFISVDVFAWAAPVEEHMKSLKLSNFISDSVLPLETLCNSVVLRVLIPDAHYDMHTKYLSDDLLRLRTDRVTSLGDALTGQVEHCKLFCLSQTRPAVMLPYAPSEYIFRYAEKIVSFVPNHPDSGHEIITLGSHSSEEFWIHMPLTGVGVGEDRNFEQAFEWWNSLKASVNSSSTVGLCLEIPEDLPAEAHVLERWLVEPVRCLIIPLHIFCTDSNGLPVLSDAHTEVIRRFLRLYKMTILLRGGGLIENEQMPDITSYKAHLISIYEKGVAQYGIPIQPSIFPPLDTVSVNLQNESYSAFEVDHRKYSDYENAVRQFIRYRQSAEDVPEVFVAAVVGCGRGPLVTAVLNAARDCYAKVRVYALEKNPIAIAALKENVTSIWQGLDVNIVMTDMREWEAPESCDMLLSEMLGSFGDNELCPEMLRGAERFLKADGVCIPASYTSYLAPVSIPRIYEYLSDEDEDETEGVRQTVYGYTVDSSRLLSDAERVFDFHHPSALPDGESFFRSVELKFEVHNPGMLHGFSGFFEAVLYGNIEHSLVPARKTPGLLSWQDIFFPLKRPVYVKKGHCIILQFYRCRNDYFVWYEWAMMKPVVSDRHNIDGEFFRMSLQTNTS